VEMSSGLSDYGIPIRHFILHADQATLSDRIENDAVLGPSTFRRAYLQPYAEAARTWLHKAGHVVDTTDLSAEQAALQIAGSLA
jgi:hypothetical protein